MDSNATLLDGNLYFSEILEEKQLLNLLKSLKGAITADLGRIRLERGNIFKNEKAIGRNQNDVIIFELNYEENDVYPSSFRGFLYPDGSINGKIKYSLDAKCPDELFNGIYQYYQNGTLVIYGNWLFNGIDNPVFIEFAAVRKTIKKKSWQ